MQIQLERLIRAAKDFKECQSIGNGAKLNCAIEEAEKAVKNCSIPDVGLVLPLPDKNSMRQIAQHVRNSEESRDPLIYEQGILRGMEIMKNIVSGN
jgi:hypothetical protein